MDLNSLLRMGAQLFQKEAGAPAQGLPIEAIVQALLGLLGDGSGKLDLAGLVQKFSGGGLASLAQSWLSDGANASIGGAQLMQVLGAGAIGDFAKQLGIDVGSATQGLEAAIPAIIDKASSGGSLLEAAGGVDGLMGMAGKLFGR
ncbi:YidB family protein [Aquimonas voraii]|uniref:DUF937 domain-containing protein n=1 Tax=Aquimonas voraii TaxID=265719 RepID=A0A1G6VIT9_9GAMM|nr:YidB family protein [Aquimonas voraii]SDD53421.1 protein of unknown function [Aquimonas voraii]